MKTSIFSFKMEKGDIIPVKLNGKNYMELSFHLEHSVKGQGLGGYLDGTTPPSSDEKSEALGAKIISVRLNGFSIPLSRALLYPYSPLPKPQSCGSTFRNCIDRPIRPKNLFRCKISQKLSRG